MEGISKATSAESSVTHCTTSDASDGPKNVTFSQAFLRARDTVVERGLPVLYVDQALSASSILREPVTQYFSRTSQGWLFRPRSWPDAHANTSFENSNDPIFREAKRYPNPIFLMKLGDLIRLNPTKDYFISRVMDWPNIVKEKQIEDNIIVTAALFQCGYFLPRDSDYAKSLLADHFSRFPTRYLSAHLAEAMTMAVPYETHVPIVEALLDLGADPTRASFDRMSPLHETLMRTNKAAAKLLLRRGASVLPHDRDSDLYELLHEEYDPEEDRDLFEAFDQVVRHGSVEAVKTPKTGRDFGFY